MRDKLVVVVPAFNEEPVIYSTIMGITSELKNLEACKIVSKVIVVDDGSTDGTFQNAMKAGVTVLRHPLNCGLGAAIGTGFQAALRCGATIVVTFDSDGQHDPEDIAAIISPIVEDTADVVIGSRLLDPCGMPLDRRVINMVANLITWILFGVWTTDSQSGMRAFNRRAVEQIHIKTNRMEVSSEIISELSRLGLRFTEVPIKAIYTTYSREKGQPNTNSFTILAKLLLRKIR